MAKKTYNPIFGKPQQVSLPKVDLQYSTPKKPESEKAEPPKTKPVVPVFSRQTTKANHIVPTNYRQRYQESTRQGYQQALQDNAGARFHAGFMEGLSPVSLGLESEALEGSKAFLGGNIAGTMGQFAIPYAGVAPKIGKALSNVPKYAQMGKVGQAVARGVGTDLAVGVPLNTLYGVSKEGLEGKELAKSIGINTAIDLVAGGVLEVIGGVLLKSGKRVATKAEFDALPKAEQAEVLEEVSTREIVRRQLKQQDRTIETISEVPTKPETYTKIEKEVKANVNKLLAGAKPELRTEVRNLIPSFVKGETSADDFIKSVYDAAVNIPYAKAGDKELLAGVRAFLKKGIKLTDDLRQIPDFKDFRIANAGKVKFSPDGSYVDVLYGELSNVYGEVFPKTITHPVDQLQRIISVLDGNKAETIRLGDVLTETQIYDDVVFPVLDEVNDLLSLSKTRVKGTETVKGFPRYKLDTPVNPLNRPVQPQTPRSRTVVPKPKETTAKAEGVFTDYYPERRASDVVISDDYVPITVEAGYRPDDMITIYRGTVEGQTGLNNGDWVTINKQLAKDYSGNGRVIEAKVKASELYAPKGEGAEELIYSTNKSIGSDNLKVTNTPQIKTHEDTARLVRKFYDEGGSLLTETKFAEKYGLTAQEARKALDGALYNSGLLKKSDWGNYSLSNAGRKQFPKSSVPTKSKTSNAPARKDLGADTAKPQKTSEELIKEHGLIKPGMEPKAREARIPKATDAGDVQLGIRTSAEAKAINEQSYKEIQSAVEEGMATKFTVTNEKAVGEASKKIADNGLEKAHDEFRGFVQSGKMPKSKDIALGYRLMQEYQKAGDYKKVAELAIDVSELLSETGRSLQAAQIIKKLSPEGRVISVQRVAKKLSEKFDVDVKIDEATIKKVRQAKTEKEIVEATEEAAIKAWNQIPSGLQNKLNAWRYMSMLMNPKTHVRNIVGNAIFMPARGLKNLIGTGLEKAVVPVGKRTKAVISPASKADQALLKFADKDFDNVVNILRGEGKFDEGYRKLEANVFKNKILEGLRDFNMKALDVEDIWFMRAAYDSSMAQYLKANNINTKSITDELLQKARNYASDEALKATYRDANTVATAISKLKQKLATNKTDNAGLWLAQRAGGVALEGVLPFTKTPINILRRGVEYSPASIVAGIGDVIRVAKKGGDMAKALDRLATGLSGTSILLIGALAGKNQWVVGGSDAMYSSKQYQYGNMQGMQEYSIDTGEGTYTIDWAAPMSMPFFVGVELGKVFEKEGADFSKVADAITKIDDPLFNMSMLQGINDALNSWGNGDDAIGQIASNMMISYLGQYVPTVGGQIARTADDTRRATTSTTESPTKRKLEKALNRQLGKVPFASRKNEPYIDLWGRTETSGNAIENFISPGYYRPKNVTAVDKEINKLIERIDEETAKEVIPRVSNSYTVTQDKVEYRMTEKELTQFKKTRGQTSYKELERLFRSGQYTRMSDVEKAKAIRKVYDNAFQRAKEELLRKRASMPVKK